jgi:hypothetical protein
MTDPLPWLRPLILVVILILGARLVSFWRHDWSIAAWLVGVYLVVGVIAYVRR